MDGFTPFAQLAKILQQQQEPSSLGGSSACAPTAPSVSSPAAKPAKKNKSPKNVVTTVPHKQVQQHITKKQHIPVAKPAQEDENDDSALFLEALGIDAPIKKQKTSPFNNALAALAADKKNNTPIKETVPTPPIPQPPIPTDEQEALFAKAMKGVDPISAKGRDIAKKVTADAKAAVNHQTALDMFLNGAYEFVIANTDEYCEGYVAGTDTVIVNKLRAGGYSPEAHIDLHGKNAEQAHSALVWFIKNAYQRNIRTALIITGKGKNSPDGVAVLRFQVQEWLTKEPFKRVVVAFCSAKASDGGTGAMYVLLRKFKKSSGKVVWERLPSADDFI